MKEWTPEEISELFVRLNGGKKHGSGRLLMKVMRVSAQTSSDLIRRKPDGTPVKKPSQGAGIALLNLLEILNDRLQSIEFQRVFEEFVDLNGEIPFRIRSVVFDKETP